jgi:hypothetical protein
MVARAPDASVCAGPIAAGRVAARPSRCR